MPRDVRGFELGALVAGFDRAGMPVGAQLMGRPWEEHTLLRAARVIEAAVVVGPFEAALLDDAARVEGAVEAALETGLRTPDLATGADSEREAGSAEITAAVIAAL